MFDLPRSSLDGLRQEADLARAAASSTAPPSRSPSRPRRSAVLGIERPTHDAGRPDARHPEGAGRPALFRRHRHLCEGLEREPMPMPATAPTMRCASTPPTCAPRWWARAPISASPRRAASRRRWRAGGSTPTRSTIRRASTPPTTRSTSRSRPARRSTTGALNAADRDALLFGMTDEVAALVLRHNYQQSLSVSVTEAQAGEEHDRLERFMRALERQGRLDRAVEFLPDTAAMRARGVNKQYLTRPELCVLLAYAKIDLNDEILASDLPDDPLLEGELMRYFPAALQEKFEPAIRAHRLRREIAALQVVNSLVNRCGPTFVRNVGQRTGASAAAIARAFAVVRDAWKLRDLWPDIEALDSSLKAEAQIRMLVATAALPDAHRAMDAPPPAAADRHAGRDRAARRRGEGAGRPAVVAGRRGGERGAQPNAPRPSRRWARRAEIARRAAALETLAGAGDLMLAAQANGCTHRGCRARLLPAGRAAVAGEPRHRRPKAAARGPVAFAGGDLACLDELAAIHAELLASVLRAAGPQGAADPDAALALMERAPQDRAGAGRPAAGGAGGVGPARSRHARGRHRGVARACLDRENRHIGGHDGQETRDPEIGCRVGQGIGPAAASCAAPAWHRACPAAAR